MKRYTIGISTLNFYQDHLGRPPREGLINYFLQWYKIALEFASENSCTPVELILDGPTIEMREMLPALIDLVGSYSVPLTTHCPFIETNVLSHNARIREASLASYRAAIEVAGEIGASKITLHPGFANPAVGFLRDGYKSWFVTAFTGLLEEYGSSGVTLCVENMPKSVGVLTSIEQLIDFLSETSLEGLRLTYDSSHLYTAEGNTGIGAFWDAFHERVDHIHLVDNAFEHKDPHLTLGTGNVDFPIIFEKLDQYAFQGSIIIELTSRKDTEDSLKYIQQLGRILKTS